MNGTDIGAAGIVELFKLLAKDYRLYRERNKVIVINIVALLICPKIFQPNWFFILLLAISLTLFVGLQINDYCWGYGWKMRRHLSRSVRFRVMFSLFLQRDDFSVWTSDTIVGNWLAVNQELKGSPT